VTLVEMGTHLATERAGLVTLHLTDGAPDFYPSERESQLNDESLEHSALQGLRFLSEN